MIKINPDKFAQAVVASHPDLGMSQQLKEYVAAYSMAEEYNVENEKIVDPKPVNSDHRKDTQTLRNVGLI